MIGNLMRLRFWLVAWFGCVCGMFFGVLLD